jgi:lipid II:glycine glycyltransferase (peptidoglycan interpeptide bridge formation enzyme)
VIEEKKRATTRWFSSSTERMNSFGLNHYRNCQTTQRKIGFLRTISYTKFIDLTIDTNELLKSFEKNTQYEIRRAQREKVVFSDQITLQEFVEFYNIFADTKQRKKITYNSIEPLIKNLKITKAMAGGNCLVVHLYLCDQIASRAQLQYSATHFRKETNHDTIKLIGYANRFLHYSDMCYFKNLDYKIYDLGGYAYQTNNQDLAKINKFKDCFHGNLVKEGNYISIPLFLIRKAKEIFIK